MHEGQPIPDRRMRFTEIAPRRLDFALLSDLLRRQWPILVVVTVVVAVLSIGLSLLLPPRYDAMSRIRIDPHQVVDAAFQNRNVVSNPDSSIVDSEVSVMHSRDITEAVVRKLALASDPHFNNALKNGGNPHHGPNAPIPPKVLDAVQDAVSITREPDTYVVDLVARADDPDKAAAIANAFADEYQQSTVERRGLDASRQSKSLDTRLQSMAGQVQAADSKVAQYRASAGITQSAQSKDGTITDQQIAPLSTQLATAEAQAASARANLASARSQIASGGIQAVSGVLNSTVIADLRRQRAEVSREAAEITANYGPKHPETIRVQEQLDSLDKQLSAEAQRIVSGLQAEANSAEASAASLRGQIARLRGEQANETRATVVADSLQRVADAKRSVYDQLAQSADQIAQESRATEPQGAIVERAAPPAKKSFPKKSIFALFGIVMGLVLGTGVVIVIEVMSTGVRTVDDVERRLGVPFLASLPMLSDRRLSGKDGGRMTPADYVVAKPMSTYAEALRTVRSSLGLGRPAPSRVVAIASAVPSEGKTSTSAALARIMALSGERVVLVDCDLRRGSLGELLREARPAGLIEVLSGTASLEQALVPDVVDGLDLLPLNKPSFTPVDLFSGKAMRDLVTLLADRYDRVILDTPPLLAVNDARTLAALADDVVVVARFEGTPLRAIRTALTMLEQDEARIAGAVLSMASTRSSAVGADNPAYYYNMYRQYHEA